MLYWRSNLLSPWEGFKNFPLRGWPPSTPGPPQTRFSQKFLDGKADSFSDWDFLTLPLPPQNPDSLRLPWQVEDVTTWLWGRKTQSLSLVRLPRPTEVEQVLQAPHSIHSDTKWIHISVGFWITREKSHQNSPFRTPFPLFLCFDCMFFYTFVPWSLFPNARYPDTDGLGSTCKDSKGSMGPTLC